MAPWKLPLVVAGIVVPIAGGFLVAGPALGVAVGALAVVVVLAVAVAAKPRGPIGLEPEHDHRRVLIATTRAVEDAADVGRIAAAAGQAGGYRTEPSWPPTPQARSGSTATSAAQHTAAAAGAGSHRRTVTTAAAPATA